MNSTPERREAIRRVHEEAINQTKSESVGGVEEAAGINKVEEHDTAKRGHDVW